ncbi:von Willebrand factor D and EGF domain-containing protein-like [Pecten maximus]|uniref:von Willebrand factor D and EGF domain-containing protein-like n=1 Tax=Pecten maximus TaxID=6579 RepID=UPI0014581F9C|nr:von Willebrand factor D and EGF domain-containing protein-like [Pecten maximus]
MTVVRLENLTMTSSPGTPGKSVLGEMLDLDCRNNCSRNGRCTNGICECFDDFEGSDCSIRRSLPPIMSSRTNPGLCQSDVYACTTFYVSGSNFASENVTCRAVHLTIHESTYQLTSQNETFPAVPMSGGIGCSCSIPQSRRIRRSAHDNAAIAEGFFLSVSNDGVVFSDDVLMLVYNSTCFTCNTTSISCNVKSSCQSTTSTLPTTSPSSSSVSTTLPTTQDDQHHGYINTGLVVGAVVGVLGCAVVILVLTKLISVHVNSRKKAETVDLDEEYQYRRNNYWEQGRGYPSLGRSTLSSRIHTRFY